MTTIQCAVQLLTPEDKPKRIATRARYLSCVSRHRRHRDRRAPFRLQQGDSFVVPLWYAHRHLNRSSSEDAILFSMSDAPALKALDLYREES